MSKPIEIRLSGSGGQGLILCTVILAEAAVNEGKYAAQSQSYGPEARGGMCKAEAVISDEPIDFPRVTNAAFLLALTQSSLDKYAVQTDENCLIMADSRLTLPARVKGKVVYAPILDTAENVLKKPITANIIAAGAINECLKLASDAALEEAVLMHVPSGMEELNRRALAEGKKLAQIL